MSRGLNNRTSFIALTLVFSVLLAGKVSAASYLLEQYLAEVDAGEFVPNADAFGRMRSDLPVAPVLAAGEQVGWVFLTSDLVSTTFYSGKPIHVLIAIGVSI